MKVNIFGIRYRNIPFAFNRQFAFGDQISDMVFQMELVDIECAILIAKDIFPFYDNIGLNLLFVSVNIQSNITQGILFQGNLVSIIKRFERCGISFSVDMIIIDDTVLCQSCKIGHRIHINLSALQN